ncbi:MAG: prolyl oligopeptidase family serine peptidase [Armatimonadetes bacterium]|nr:prolyl oligopeptidase family serine peptidase [Armatimonadota bacterium]
MNSLTQPVRQAVAATQPIWQGNPVDKPAVGTGRGLPLDLQLHAKRGRGGMEWLWFGDRQLGWRDGLPFKFGAQARGGSVVLTPTDRTWIDRLMPEGKDECQRLTPAIHSFWFGYNERINEPAAMPGAPVVNYTERRLLTLVRWAQGYFDTDRQRSYCTGGSMGGCGTISFGFRHPEIFAACSAIVPIVAFDRGPGGDSAMRIEVECGGLEALTSAGLPVKEHLDSTRFATQHPDDLPFLFIVTGRNDSSIPWWKNPAFYRALRDGRHGFIAAWNEGAHGDTQAKLPPDLAQRASLAWLHRFALDQSYLAFSNSSADDDPGQGGKSEGTPAGAFNRGLDFEPPVESSTSYEAAVLWYLEPARLPVTVDITPRRRQQFRPAPGTRVFAENVGADGVVTQRIETTVAPAGTLTVPGFSLTSARQMLRLRLAE